MTQHLTWRETDNDATRVLPGAPARGAPRVHARAAVDSRGSSRIPAARAVTVHGAGRLDARERAPRMRGGGDGVSDDVAWRSRAIAVGDAVALRATVERADGRRPGDGRRRVESRRPVFLRRTTRIGAAGRTIPVVHPLRRHSPSRAALGLSATHGCKRAGHLRTVSRQSRERVNGASYTDFVLRCLSPGAS